MRMLLGSYDLQIGIKTQKATQGLQSLAKHVQNLDNSFKKLASTVGSAAGAFLSFQGIKQSLKLWAEQEKATLKLSFAVKQFAKGNAELFKSLRDLGNQLQTTIGVGNEYVENLAAVGLSLGITADKIEDATKGAILLSKVLGTDAQTILRGMAVTLQGQIGLLGRYVPALREMTAEQLKSGEAIKYIVNNFSDLEKVLAGTTMSNLERMAADIGDLGEVIGAFFAPILSKISIKLHEFVGWIAKPKTALEDLKKSVLDMYNSLSPLAKGIIAFVGSFLAFELAVNSAKLLGSAIVWMSKGIIGALKAITNPLFWLVAGVYVFSVAWRNNWFGIQDITTKVWNAINPIFTELWNWISQSWDWALNLIGAGWDWIIDHWDEIEATIDTVWNFTLTLFGKAWDWLKPAWEFIVKGIKSTWKFTVSLFGKLKDWLVEHWDDIVKGIEATWDFTVELFGALKDWFVANFDILVKGFKAVWNFSIEIFGALKDWIVAHWDDIVNGIKAVWEFTWNFLGNAWDWIKDKWNWLINGLNVAWDITWKFLGEAWDWLKEFGKNLLQGLSIVWNFTWNFLGDAWNWMKVLGVELLKDLQIVWNVVWNFLGEAWDWLKIFGDKIFQGLKVSWLFVIDILGDAWSWIKDNWNIIIDGIKAAWQFSLELIGDTWTWIKNTLKFFVEGVKSVWQISITILGDFAQWVIETWNNIKTSIKTVWNFVINLTGDVVNFVKTIIAGIVPTFNAALQISVDFLGTLGEFVANVVKQGFSIFKTIWQFTPQFVGFLGEVLTGLLSAAWEVINTVWKFSVEGLEFIETIVDWIGTTIQTTWEWTIKIPEWFAKLLSLVFGGNQKKPTNNLQDWANALKGRKHQVGGYTANIGVSQIAGVVHGGEWVAPAWMVKNPIYGRIIQWLERARLRGYQTGGYVTRLDLSTSTRAWSPDWGLEDYIKDVTTTMMKDFAMVSNIVSQTLDKFGLDLDKYLDEVEKNIEGFKALKSQLDESRNKIDELKEQIDAAFNETEKTTEGFGNLKATLKENLGAFKHVNMKLVLFKTAMENLRLTFLEAIASVSEIFTISDRGVVLSQEFKGLIDIISGFVSGNLLKLIEGFGNLAGVIVNMFAKYENISKLLNIVSTILKPIVDVVGPLIDSVLSPFVNLIESLSTAFGGFLNILLTGFGLLKPLFLTIGVLINSISFLIDQFVLWINSLPLVGGFLTQEQISRMQRSIQERTNEMINGMGFNTQTEQTTQSTVGQTFHAGNVSQITNNFNVTFTGNYIVDETDIQFQRFAEKIWQWIKDHHEAEIVVGG